MLAGCLFDRNTRSSAGGRVSIQMKRGGEQTQTHLNNVEELGGDRRDAPEKVGSAGAFHLVTVPLDFDECAPLHHDVPVYSSGIHVPDAGVEHRRSCADIARHGSLLLCQLFKIPK